MLTGDSLLENSYFIFNSGKITKVVTKVYPTLKQKAHLMLKVNPTLKQKAYLMLKVATSAFKEGSQYRSVHSTE